jgi:hypothetical protein
MWLLGIVLLLTLTVIRVSGHDLKTEKVGRTGAGGYFS